MTNYIALIRKASDSDYSVDFPDVPGCVTAGKDLDEASAFAREALAGHLQLLAEKGEAPPEASSLEAVMDDPENRDAIAALVSAPLDLAGAVQVIEQDVGPRFAVVPWHDWARIMATLEDYADASLVRLNRARIAAGEETIPSEVVHAIYIDGEPPLAAYRKWRGLGLAELAARAGLDQAYVSELETGKKTPSPEALKALAAVLDLDPELLIPQTGDEIEEFEA